jgi:hypothetical protein
MASEKRPVSLALRIFCIFWISVGCLIFGPLLLAIPVAHFGGFERAEGITMSTPSDASGVIQMRDSFVQTRFGSALMTPVHAVGNLASQFHAATSSRTAAPSTTEAVALDPRQIAADPTGYLGKNVKVVGKVNAVQQRGTWTWAQLLAFAPPYDGNIFEPMIVETASKDPALVRQACYAFWGTVEQPQDTKLTSTGASVSVPTLHAYTWAPVSSDRYGNCLPAFASGMLVVGPGSAAVPAPPKP